MNIGLEFIVKLCRGKLIKSGVTEVKVAVRSFLNCKKMTDGVVFNFDEVLLTAGGRKLR